MRGFRHLNRRAAGRRSTRSNRPATAGYRLLFDRRDSLWVATLGQGLLRVRGDDMGSTVERLTEQTGLSGDTVLCLFEDREGNIWIGTAPGVDPALGSQNQGRHASTRDTPDATPSAIEATPDGSVWIGTRAGLIRFQNDTRTLFGRDAGLPGPGVSALHTDERGTLWIASAAGIVRYAGGTFEPIRAAARDPLQPHHRHRRGQPRRVVDLRLRQGALSLAGGRHEGIRHAVGCRQQPGNGRLSRPHASASGLASGPRTVGVIEGDRFRTYSRADGLPGGRVHGIYEDQQDASGSPPTTG